MLSQNHVRPLACLLAQCLWFHCFHLTAKTKRRLHGLLFGVEPGFDANSLLISGRPDFVCNVYYRARV